MSKLLSLVASPVPSLVALPVPVRRAKRSGDRRRGTPRGMQFFVKALWQGIMSGASARDRAGAARPESFGYSGSIAQALYWLGFELANVVVHGART